MLTTYNSSNNTTNIHTSCDELTFANWQPVLKGCSNNELAVLRSTNKKMLNIVKNFLACMTNEFLLNLDARCKLKRIILDQNTLKSLESYITTYQTAHEGSDEKINALGNVFDVLREFIYRNHISGSPTCTTIKMLLDLYPQLSLDAKQIKRFLKKFKPLSGASIILPCSCSLNDSKKQAVYIALKALTKNIISPKSLKLNFVDSYNDESAADYDASMVSTISDTIRNSKSLSSIDISFDDDTNRKTFKLIVNEINKIMETKPLKLTLTNEGTDEICRLEEKFSQMMDLKLDLAELGIG